MTILAYILTTAKNVVKANVMLRKNKMPMLISRGSPKCDVTSAGVGAAGLLRSISLSSGDRR